MATQYSVYHLLRPHENAPFYVGVTSDPLERSRTHQRKYGSDISFVSLHVFECIFKARDCETHYIKEYEAEGIKLLNRQGTLAYKKSLALRKREPTAILKLSKTRSKNMINIQITIPRYLAIALRFAATEDYRTPSAFLQILLENCPAIRKQLVNLRS